MKIRPAWLLAALIPVLSACGNKGPLMHPSRVPPEDAGRYLIKPKPQPEATQPQATDAPAVDEPAVDAPAVDEPAADVPAADVPAATTSTP